MSTIPNLITSKAIKVHLDNLTHEEYMSALFKEPEEYINYFDQVLNHPDWKLDISKTDQLYLKVFEETLKSHKDLYNVVRLPLHEEIPFLDRETVKRMYQEHPSLNEKKVASAVTDFSPYTIVDFDETYGPNLVKDIKRELSQGR